MRLDIRSSRIAEEADAALQNRIEALYLARIGKRGGFSTFGVTYSAAHHFYGSILN
jgi:hypothetical protein